MHHSLVFFTVLCQAAAGSLIAREITAVTCPGRSPGKKPSQLLVILGLMVVSLFTAFFHLGNPLNAGNALNNLKTSWLSREVIFLIIFTVSLTAQYISENNGWKKPFSKFLSAISTLSALLLLYSMIRIYMLQSVASWNHYNTPLSFLLTAALCGVALNHVFGSSNLVISVRLQKIMILLLAAGIAASLMYNSLPFRPLPVLLTIRITMSILAIIILLQQKTFIPANKTGILTVIVFIIITASEIINRYIFFLSFEKSGL